MRAVFADTCYWIALLNPKDQTHDIAVDVSKGLGSSKIITTEEVLTELLNYFGARGPYFRSAAAKLVERMQADCSIQILPQTRESFLAGLRLYTARPDKGYSLSGLPYRARRRFSFSGFRPIIHATGSSPLS